MHLAILRKIVLASLPLLAASCTTSRWHDHQFMPAPLELEVRTEEVAGSQVRALVSVVGIAREHEGAEAHAVVRLRLENLGTVTAQLDNASLQLVSADLQTFGKGEIDSTPSDPPVPIAPGATASYDVSFALPPGRDVDNLNLEGLNLRWTIVFDDHRVTTGATFQRVQRPVYDDDDPRVNVGFGFGYYHGHCW